MIRRPASGSRARRSSACSAPRRDAAAVAAGEAISIAIPAATTAGQCSTESSPGARGRTWAKTSCPSRGAEPTLEDGGDPVGYPKSNGSASVMPRPDDANTRKKSTIPSPKTSFCCETRSTALRRLCVAAAAPAARRPRIELGVPVCRDGAHPRIPGFPSGPRIDDHVGDVDDEVAIERR